MIEIKKVAGNILENATMEDKNIWISLTNPTEQELELVKRNFQIDDDFLKASLDPEEVSRLETEEDQVLVLINAPFEEEYQEKMTYSTLPIGIIIKDDVIITVTLRKIKLIENMKSVKKSDANINKKTKFVFQVILNITLEYLRSLREIDKLTNNIEKKLIGHTKNEYLLQLLTLEKNLVYFITALKSNEQVLNKIVRFKSLPIYEEDLDLFDDVIIELKQAQEMASINSMVIRSIRDAFASITSNNLNNIMKILASFTIILTVPTMIFSFFGMNTKMNLIFSNMYSTSIILIVSIIISAILYKIMKKKNMF